MLYISGYCSIQNMMFKVQVSPKKLLIAQYFI